MALANVTLNNTFDEWRNLTNQVISYVNDIDGQQLLALGPTLANTARDAANSATLLANAGIIQANTARVHANAAHASANAGMLQANTARDHANTAHVSANAGLLQANTARDHANAAFLAANSGTSTASAFAQANTARDQANAAYSAANAATSTSSIQAFIQANTARDHANASFTKANTGLANTSGIAFAGNMQFPTGNITIGDGETKGIRLHVNSLTSIANVDPQIEVMSGSQILQFNSNTSVGSWNDLMLNRDLSIIFSKGTSDDGANLVIGPWTDSSFGYKQDGAGRHGFNTSNPRHVLDANGTANISGSLLVGAMNVVPTVTASFAHANASFAKANSGATVINTDAISATRYIVFTDKTSGQLANANVATALSYNPSTAILTATKLKSSALYDSSDRQLLIKDSTGTVVWGN